MRPLIHPSQIPSSLSTYDVTEMMGEESLVIDARARLRPADAVERKLQSALQLGRIQFKRHATI
jgi:hypothetical protein